MTIPDVNPIPNPIHLEAWTNPYTGGPYYYDAARNSWIFQPIEEGEQIGRPPFDPADGNLWVDRETEYLLYIYNQGEAFATDEPGWISLTTLKRPYDYMVTEIETDDSKLTPIDIESKDKFVNYYSTGYMYFNSNDMDLKVWLGDVDEYDRPMGTGDWVSITQHSVVTDQEGDPPSIMSQLTSQIIDLEKEIAELEEQVEAITGEAFVFTPIPRDEDVGPIAVNNYYPLYETAAKAELSGDGTYHTHEFGGVTYYMPNGVEFWHGNYGVDEDGDDGSTPAPTPEPTPTPTPTPTPDPSPGY